MKSEHSEFGGSLAKVFMMLAKLCFAVSARGCRLAWSRLVDLGSIDPGSNPGSPTNGSEPFRSSKLRNVQWFYSPKT